MSRHTRSWCRDCRWSATGPNAPLDAREHSTTRMHSTTTSTHPRHLCTDECRMEKP